MMERPPGGWEHIFGYLSPRKSFVTSARSLRTPLPVQSLRADGRENLGGENENDCICGLGPCHR